MYICVQSCFRKQFPALTTIQTFRETSVNNNNNNMASSTFYFAGLSLICLIACTTIVNAQLYPNFYARTCPNLERIVRSTMAQAVSGDSRMAASILRLFFHDCFVNGCDASVLLDDTPTFKGEKNAYANQNSLRGFEVIDWIKFNVEASCRATVSCADILALAARDAVVLVSIIFFISILQSGGHKWTVLLGRRDARTTSSTAADINLPPPSANLTTLISLFAAKGLTARDMTALSGAHTIGQARCMIYRDHIYKEPNVNPNFVMAKKATCPAIGGDYNLSPLDAGTPSRFDNGYFKSLVARQGLLHSDQELFNNGSQDAWVRLYAKSNYAFAMDFIAAIVKMGNISPLTGTNGEIRRNCRVAN